MRATAVVVASAADPPLPIREMAQLKLDGYGSSSSCLLFHVAVLLQGYPARPAVIATSRLRLRCLSLSLPPPPPPLPPSL
jgi:hypothetical protein